MNHTSLEKKEQKYSSIAVDDKILESISQKPLESHLDISLNKEDGDRVEENIKNICKQERKPLFFLEEELIVGLLGSIAVGVVLDSYIAMFIAIGLTLFFRFSRKE